MTRRIVDPDAIVRIRWIPAAEGGREPPLQPRFAATAVFELGGESETIPGWPGSGDHYSVLFELKDSDTASVEFFAIERVAELLSEGASFYVMEGMRAVGVAQVLKSYRGPPSLDD